MRRRGTETSLVVAALAEAPEDGVATRAVRTLTLMHRWGYAPPLETLAEQLLGGSASPGELKATLSRSSEVHIEDGFICLRGDEGLLEKSRERVRSDRSLNHSVRIIAEEFTRDLVRHCPFLECIALSGSVASGGYARGDDIDFDLFVETGTKYVSYLMANLLGLKYAWRYRNIESDDLHRMPLLPKVTCINVVWPADQTRPFVRQDAGLAFELLRCLPLWGAQRFREVLDDNSWLDDYVPQLRNRRSADLVSISPSPIWRILSSLRKHRAALRWLESGSRTIAWLLYHFVQGSRRRLPGAKERMEFLRRVKFPYEVFQD